jgi:hypothetical protein
VSTWSLCPWRAWMSPCSFVTWVNDHRSLWGRMRYHYLLFLLRCDRHLWGLGLSFSLCSRSKTWFRSEIGQESMTLIAAAALNLIYSGLIYFWLHNLSNILVGCPETCPLRAPHFTKHLHSTVWVMKPGFSNCASHFDIFFHLDVDSWTLCYFAILAFSFLLGSPIQ